MSHFVSPESGAHYPLFGPATSFDTLARRLRVPVLGRVPLEPGVSTGGDEGQPVALRLVADGKDKAPETARVFEEMAGTMWRRIEEIEHKRDSA